MADLIFSRYLDTDGDGGGTKEATGDYSSAAEGFFISPNTATQVPLDLYRMLIYVSDAQNWSADAYGQNLTLTNGIQVRVIDSSETTLVDLTDGIPIKTNAGWHALCHDVTYTNYGTGADFLSVRWTFSKAGRPIRLLAGERLEVTLNDNFSGLLAHRFLVQGLELWDGSEWS